MNKYLFVKGEESYYGTIGGALAHFNLNIKYNTAWYRISKGMDPSKALFADVKRRKNMSNKPKIYTVCKNSEVFTGTIKDIIRHFNISLKPKTISARINAYGWDVNDAFFKDNKWKTYKIVNPDTGEIYFGSIENAIRYFGVDISIIGVHYRIKQGMSVNDAIFTKKTVNNSHNKIKKYHFTSPNGDEYYGGIDGAISHFKLWNAKKVTVYDRIHRQHLSPSEALFR